MNYIKLTFLIGLLFIVSNCSRTGDISLGGIETITQNPLEIVQFYGAEHELGGIDKDIKLNADKHCKNFNKTAYLKFKKFILRGQTTIIVHSCK